MFGGKNLQVKALSVHFLSISLYSFNFSSDLSRLDTMGCSILARNVQRTAALCLASRLLSEFKGQSFCSLATCSPYPSLGPQTQIGVVNLYTQLLAIRQLSAAVRLPCCLQTGNGRFLACANINLLTRHLTLKNRRNATSSTSKQTIDYR